MRQPKQLKLLLNKHEDKPFPAPKSSGSREQLKVDSMRTISLMQTREEASHSREADGRVQIPATPNHVSSYIRNESDSRDANMDAAIGFIDDLNRGDLSAWEMEAVVYQEGDLGERPGKA